MLARAPGDITRANAAQANAPHRQDVHPSSRGERGSVPGYAGSERAAGQRTGGQGVTMAGRDVRGLDVIDGESFHRVTASGRQARARVPGPGTHVRQLQLPPDTARHCEHHGRLPPVTPGILAAVGG